MKTTKKKLAFVMMAIVPAVLFGGFFMAEAFTSSNDVSPAEAMTPVVQNTDSGVSYTINEHGDKDYTVTLTENIGLSDSVEVGSP